MEEFFFWGKFFGKIFWKNFLKIFLEEFFWRNFLGGNFLEKFEGGNFRRNRPNKSCMSWNPPLHSTSLFIDKLIILHWTKRNLILYCTVVYIAYCPFKRQSFPEEKKYFRSGRFIKRQPKKSQHKK